MADALSPVPPRLRQRWIQDLVTAWGAERKIAVQGLAWLDCPDSESSLKLVFAMRGLTGHLELEDDLTFDKDLLFTEEEISLSQTVKEALVEVVSAQEPESPFSFVVADTKDNSRPDERPWLVPTSVDFTCHCGHRWRAAERDHSPKGLHRGHGTTCPNCGRRLKIDDSDVSHALWSRPRRRW